MLAHPAYMSPGAGRGPRLCPPAHATGLVAWQPVAVQSIPALLPAGGNRKPLVLHALRLCRRYMVLVSWCLAAGDWGDVPAGLEQSSYMAPRAPSPRAL